MTTNGWSNSTRLDNGHCSRIRLIRGVVNDSTVYADETQCVASTSLIDDVNERSDHVTTIDDLLNDKLVDASYRNNQTSDAIDNDFTIDPNSFVPVPCQCIEVATTSDFSTDHLWKFDSSDGDQLLSNDSLPHVSSGSYVIDENRWFAHRNRRQKPIDGNRHGKQNRRKSSSRINAKQHHQSATVDKSIVDEMSSNDDAFANTWRTIQIQRRDASLAEAYRVIREVESNSRSNNNRRFKQQHHDPSAMRDCAGAVCTNCRMTYWWPSNLMRQRLTWMRPMMVDGVSSSHIDNQHRVVDERNCATYTIGAIPYFRCPVCDTDTPNVSLMTTNYICD